MHFQPLGNISLVSRSALGLTMHLDGFGIFFKYVLKTDTSLFVLILFRAGD